MKPLGVKRGILAVIALTAASGNASPPSRDQDVCADMVNLRESIAHFQHLPLEATVKDVRLEEKRLRALGERIYKEARQDQHATELNASIRNLGKAVEQLPDDEALPSVQASIHQSLDAVTRESQAFSLAHCPAGS